MKHAPVKSAPVMMDRPKRAYHKRKEIMAVVIPKKRVLAKKKKAEIEAQAAEALSNLKRERFCQNYVKVRALFGNAQNSYAEAYGYDFLSLSTESPVTKTNRRGKPVEWGKSERERAEQMCAVEGGRLLRIPYVNDRIQQLLLDFYNEDHMDAELSYVATQREELPAKVAAIKEFNAVRGRVRTAVDHTHKLIGVVKHVYDLANKLDKSQPAAENGTK